MARIISNSDDILDSRDVIARIEELEEKKQEFILNESMLPDDESPSWGEVAEAGAEAESRWDATEEGEELTALLSLAEEAEGYASDWKYGETLIRDSYFEDYAKEFVKDIGGLPRDLLAWIEDNINWKGVAEDIQVDYTSVDWGGVTYWIR